MGGGDDEPAVVDHGEVEAALAVGSGVAEVLGHERAGEVRAEDDDAPLAGQGVLGVDLRAANAADRLVAEADAESADEAGATRERLVAAGRLGR